jgi:hypothetical protein
MAEREEPPGNKSLITSYQVKQINVNLILEELHPKTVFCTPESHTNQKERKKSIYNRA